MAGFNYQYYYLKFDRDQEAVLNDQNSTDNLGNKDNSVMELQLNTDLVLESNDDFGISKAKQ